MSILKIIPLEDERKYTKVINGQRYDVVALERVIVAKKPGDLVVDPFILETGVVVGGRSRSRNPF